MAVGEIAPLLQRAKGAQIDLTFELIRDYELLRLQAQLVLRNIFKISSSLYDVHDLKRNVRYEKWKKAIKSFFTHTTYIDENIFGSYNETEDKPQQQLKIIVEITDGQKNPKESNKIINKHTTNKPLWSIP